MTELYIKFKEVLISVLPITVIVLILNFTLTPMEPLIVIQFIIGAVLIVVGLTIFLIGVDLGITPIGNEMGTSITKSNNIWIVIVIGLFLGFAISIAEPDLHILADQVEMVTSGVLSKMGLVVVVSMGIAVMVAAGLVRIVYNFPLYISLTILYGIIFVLAMFVPPAFLAISFDASGATTGALTVPFILALATGVSHLKKDSKASEKDSFGLVAIASSGAIIAVMIMSIIFNASEISGSLNMEPVANNSIFGVFIHEIGAVSQEILIALAPVVVIFLVFQRASIRMSKLALKRILFGVLFTFVGLVLFLTGVNAGFMDVGSLVGFTIASMDSSVYVVVVGFILGLVTILAEPAVNVLTHQIEDVTSGYVNRKIVMVSLCLGAGAAVALSMIRILVPSLQLWHFLLPGYIICVLMMYFVPKLFVGMAFDSGGVASGPMTATFILAYAQGAAEAIEGADVLIDGFGMIAMVAMTPIIALQTLGFIFKIKSKKKGTEENG